MSYRLTKIYTRTGDDGTTSLGDKNRVMKNSARIEILGTLDELNSAIGMILAHKPSHTNMQSCLLLIQQNLFNLGSELCPPYNKVITSEDIHFLENQLDEWNNNLPPLKEFILPGGTLASAACHMARTICRRAERRLVSLNQTDPVNPETLRYLNRLSDLLFVAARVLTKEEQCEERMWEHEKKKR